MYVINDYQLVTVASQIYLTHYDKGAKISSDILADILQALQKQTKLEISAEDLATLALQHRIDVEALKKVLINQLNILKPAAEKKFPLIYINADDANIALTLQTTLATNYSVEIVPETTLDFAEHSLVIFYRKNYSSTDFNRLQQQVNNHVYLITAGVLHKLLIIDNLYFNGSGLPTHTSNLHQLMTYLRSDISTTKNNWLLLYRDMMGNAVDQFPEPHINACQQGYIAYCLYQFAAQFTHLWKTPTPFDQINWFWHVDLTSFNVHREVAIHSPFSEFDMKLHAPKKRVKECV